MCVMVVVCSFKYFLINPNLAVNAKNHSCAGLYNDEDIHTSLIEINQCVVFLCNGLVLLLVPITLLVLATQVIRMNSLWYE